jgi:predicted transposase YdaD
LHQLPTTADTLWLRILGRDNVQIRAIAEIVRLPIDSPYRQNALELFSNLKIILESKQNKNSEEIELIMKLSPLYLEQIDLATQQGEAKGLERGRVEEGRMLIIRLLNRKLGQLNPETIAQINSLALVKIELLGDALLDFDRLEDLLDWLNNDL